MLPRSWPIFPAATARLSLSQTYADVFHPPVNTQLQTLWDTVDSRLYNLRHNLDINGNRLNLPLYATPLDPAAMLAREINGGTTQGVGASSTVVVPPYRYEVMAGLARQAVSTLMGFGQQLLGYRAAIDGRHAESLQQSQILNLWSFTDTATQQAVDIANATLASLQSSLAAAQQRRDYYQGLYDGGLSVLEKTAQTTDGIAQGSVLGSEALLLTAGGLKLIPNIFGFADGGCDVSGPVWAGAMTAKAAGQISAMISTQTAISATYERRKDDWKFQAQQAGVDVQTLQAEITTQQLQIAAASNARAMAKAQHAQMQSMYQFLTQRFTNEALYQWLAGQMAPLYYQAYDAAAGLCKLAEACWQYELGDKKTSFFGAGTWDDRHQGLMSGEPLQVALQKMDSMWYSERNTRKLEITRTLSVRNTLGESAWKAALDTAKANANGEIQVLFSFKEKDFDDDYPGHYLRQIVNVSVTLPAAIGPTQNVRATLTQTTAALVTAPLIDAVKAVDLGKTVTGLMRDSNVGQQIALSGGMNDSGLFVLNFGDARYLPFEGTGAVSDWILAFPNVNSKSGDQKQVLDSLDDIIVTMRYTARNGGDAFAKSVLDHWNNPGNAA